MGIWGGQRSSSAFNDVTRADAKRTRDAVRGRGLRPVRPRRKKKCGRACSTACTGTRPRRTRPVTGAPTAFHLRDFIHVRNEKLHVRHTKLHGRHTKLHIHAVVYTLREKCTRWEKGEISFGWFWFGISHRRCRGSQDSPKCRFFLYTKAIARVGTRQLQNTQRGQQWTTSRVTRRLGKHGYESRKRHEDANTARPAGLPWCPGGGWPKGSRFNTLHVTHETPWSEHRAHRWENTRSQAGGSPRST